MSDVKIPRKKTKINVENPKTEEITVPLIKPILKWIGGKSQIITKVISTFPKEMDNYHEIFLGGGSVLFALLNEIINKKIKVKETINAYDFNCSLINMYKNMQKEPLNVYKHIDTLIKEYYQSIDNSNKDSNKDSNNDSSESSESSDSSDESNKDSSKESSKNKKIIINRKPKNKEEAMVSGESYYYWIRQTYNKMNQTDKNNTKGSAYFIFLNKTCFRGMYRESLNGFNVPYGNYSKPEIVNKEHLLSVSELIKNVNFIHMSFEESLKLVKDKDFIYMDPPYAPEKKTSFVGYTKDGFDNEFHEKLFKLCDNMKKNKIKFVMSNSYVDLVKNAFPSNLYNVEVISCKRSINSKKPNSKTNEVLIKSF